MSGNSRFSPGSTKKTESIGFIDISGTAWLTGKMFE
jgi:hypothetical protein